MALVKIDFDRAKADILAAMPHGVDRSRILKGLGAAAFAHWKKLAKERVNSTERDYVAGLKLEEDGDTTIIALDGTMPNMVEWGWGGGDMREWMLRSKKAKQGKRGPYLVIPFRHGTPGTTGANVGPQMPAAIYEVARKLSPTVSRPGRGVSTHGGKTTMWGQRLHAGLPMGPQARRILTRKEKPWHSNPLHEGMVRKAKTISTGAEQTTGYQTFRTISMHSNEPGKHWIHPGIKPRMIHRDVQRYVRKIAHALVMQALEDR